MSADPFAYTFSLPAQGNHDHDASRQALMNDEQQSYMDKFWEEPDQTTTNNTNEVLAFNFVGSGLNDKTGDSGVNTFGLHMSNGMDFSVGMGLSGNHMSMPAPSAPCTVNHVAPAYLSQYDASKGFEDFVYQNDPSVTSNNSQLTHDDQAASALMSMSSNSQEHSQPTAPSGSSWGNLNMNNSNNYSGDQPHMGGDPSSGSTNTPLTPTFTDGFQRPGRAASHAQYQPHNLMQQASQASNYAQARHPSLPMRGNAQAFSNQAEQWQMPNATVSQEQNQTQRRPPIYQYGSDQNFSQQGYQAAGYAASETQYNGLLNLPLAGVVSESTMPITTAQQAGGMRDNSQHRHSLPNNLQDLSSAALVHQHGALQPADSTFLRRANQMQANHAIESTSLSQQPRERRRSQAEDDSALSYGQVQGDAQNNISAPRRAPVKQEAASVHRQTANATPPSTSNKRPRSSPTASATASASPSTPAASNFRASSSSKKRRSDAKQPRHNLSDTQKRNNHIASEQKRRDAMKINYEELNIYVPHLRAGTQGLSRSEILQHSGDWLQTLKVGNDSIMAAYGVTFDDITDDGADDHDESKD